MGYFTNLAILVILVILVNSTYSANIWILVDFTNMPIFGNLVILVKFGIYVKKCYFCISTGICIFEFFVEFGDFGEILFFQYFVYMCKYQYIMKLVKKVNIMFSVYEYIWCIRNTL